MLAILSGPEVRHKHPAINFRTRFYPSHLFFASLRVFLRPCIYLLAIISFNSSIPKGGSEVCNIA